MISPKHSSGGNRVSAASLVKSRSAVAAAKSTPAKKAAKAPSGAPFKMTKKHWVAFGVFMLLFVIGVAWAVIHFSKDRRFDDLAALRERLLDPLLTKEERQEIQDELQQRREAMMPEIQKKAADGSAIFMQFITTHMKQVLALPKDQVLAAIDRDIDNMEAMRQMFGQMGRGNRQGGQGDAKTGPRNADRATTGRNDSNQPQDNSRGGGPGGRPPGMGPGPMGSDAQRAAFRNQMLSSIPADTRASFQTYVQLFQARAVQRGINLPR